MSHNVGRVVATASLVVGPDGPAAPVSPGVWEQTFTPAPAPDGGPPRFVILHLSLVIPAGSRVEVPLGYDTDVYTGGTDVWTRPIDTVSPIKIRFVAGPGVTTGHATLSEYGSGERYTTTYAPSQSWLNSTTNTDLFLHTNPYQEPTYQTWLQCGGSINWQNAACAAPGSVQEQTARAVGMFVHAGHADGGVNLLSTCSGTLIDTNLFLTARHCAVDVDELDIRSGSVTFDFQTDCAGSRPPGYSPRFYKVRRVAAAGAGVNSWVAEVSDWLILELEQVPVGVAPRPLRGTATMANEPIFAVHHPNGAVKKIQSGTLTSGDVTSVSGLDYGGGSSGSALFDTAGNVIGAALSTGDNGAYQCGVGYTPARRVLDALAAPAAPPTPFDIMLVIDHSGSMGEPASTGVGTKMAEAREAASLFVQLVRLNAGDRLGMVSFSTTATNPVDEAPGNVNNGKRMQLVGPAPYTGGKIGALAPDAATSIGAGIQQAMSVLPAGTGNQRVVLLLTDGMQNTWPMIADVEGLLGNTVVHAIGFGSEAQLDGVLLNRLAHAHGGLYTRAKDGLDLKKFFGLAFGNIFGNGALADPTLVLDAGVEEATAIEFNVCDEERITAVVGWGAPNERLEVDLISPAGAVIGAGTATTESDAGMTWSFIKAPLPIGGEREGAWKLRVRRPKAEAGVETRVANAAGSSRQAIRYVASVLAEGGPRMAPVRQGRRFYTGDRFNPLVALQYANGTAPEGEVVLEVERLAGSLGELVERHGAGSPVLGPEPVGAFAAALQQIEREAGGKLPIPTVVETIPLFDDAVHEDGGMERDGVWGNPQDDLLRYEGTYTFRAVGEYGHHCRGRREAMWSLHVELGIDPDASETTVVRPGVIRIRPRDRYGSPLGPGRGGGFTVSGAPGTTVTGGVIDNGDGTYDVPVSGGSGGAPGVVVSQPDRTPVVLTAGGGGMQRGCLVWLIVVLAVLVVVLTIALLVSL